MLRRICIKAMSLRGGQRPTWQSIVLRLLRSHGSLAMTLSLALLFFIPTLHAETSPQRIVSLNLCADELLLRLVEPEQIVGVTNYSKTPDVESLLNNNPSIKKIKGDAEEVLALRPDLVITGVFNDPKIGNFLKELGAYVVTIGVPKNIDEIYANIGSMGRILNRSNEANSLIQNMQRELSVYQNSVGTKNRMIFYQRGAYVPGKNTFEDALMSWVGGYNIASEIGINGYGRLDLESLLIIDPDIMIFMEDEYKRSSVGQDLLRHPSIKTRYPEMKHAILPSHLLHCGGPSSVVAVKALVESINP